jgi:TonB family protein
MRLTGVAMVLAVVGGCAESTPAQRQSSGGTSESSAQQSEPDPASVTPERMDAIERLFARKTSDLQACWVEEYEKSHNRKLEGDVTLQVVINPAGNATKVEVLKSTIGNPAIEGCVTKTVSSWSFPEGRASMPVNRTIHLGAQF